MNNILEKWKSDSKYRTKVKLLLYTGFVVIVAIYAISINNNQNADIYNDIDSSLQQENKKTSKNIINIPKEYNYIINLTIDENTYKYTGTKNITKTTIIKESNNLSTNYIYQNNEYYVEELGNYIITTKESVYEPINYNYINLETINTYLNKATKQENEYLVYLKDIILAHNSDEYFKIKVNDNKIDIDYTNLMKQFNNDIEKYEVNIEIQEIE